MIKSGLVLFSLILLLNKSNGENEPILQLKVTILYEALCPDSVHFFQTQLKPHYNKFGKYIDLHLVPFGKSYSLDNGTDFHCQHGQAECYGNRVHSCALAQTFNTPAQVAFSVCQMSGHAEETGLKCGRLAGIPFDLLDSCVNSEIGTILQLQAEAVTNAYNPTFIPTIVYDEEFDQELQDRSIRHFRRVVCELLTSKGSLEEGSIC